MMFTCLKCGRKIKTLYERVFGEKPHYEVSGYHCEACRIFYGAQTKRASRAVYGVAKNELGGERLVAAIESEQLQTVHEPHANAAQNACESEQERMQKQPITVKTEHKRTLDHLCVRQVS